MIQTISLLPGVTLRCFPDDRFKQSTLTVQFVRPMRREEAACNGLIPAVLLRGCESCPDLRAITLRLDSLYGAAVGTMVRRVGDWQTTGLCCSFIDDRCALPGEQVLAPMAEFLQELLRKPVLEQGCFRRDYIESEKRNLIQALEAQRNDKRAYAHQQMLQRMCRADAYGIPRLGEIAQAKAITPEQAYAQYQRILTESPVELFYVGSQQPDRVAALLRPVFSGLSRKVCPLPPQTPFRDSGGSDETEVMDISQGKLCMGFYTPITLKCPEFAAMQVCNAIFGGGMTCKLFMQLRETQSLCYDISSSYYGSKGILTVSAGIDSGNDALVRREVLHQLELCRQGEITPQELGSAKQALISQLRTTHDSPGAIESYYATAALSGLAMTPAEYIRAVEAVTTEQVAQAAQSLTLHTVYFLKGVQ